MTLHSSVALSKTMQACSHMNVGPSAVRLSTANALNMSLCRRSILGRLSNGQTDVQKSVRQRQRQSRSCIRLRAEAHEEGEGSSNLSLAPVKPKSAVGEMLAYYYQAQPHLFKEVIEYQFGILAMERDAKREADQAQMAGEEQPVTSSMDISLYKRIDEVKRMEHRATVEDLMYAAVLEKFLSLGIEMMGSMDNITEGAENLKSLTEGLHSREALDMVKEHVKNVMGPSAAGYANTILKMSKLQAAQVYAASIMFGYFVRRVDKRFQLERGLGLVESGPPSDAVSRLERLFAQTEAIDVMDSPSATSPAPSSASENGDARPSAAETYPLDPEDQAPPQEGRAEPRDTQGVLRKYIESFDQETMIETARLVSAEGLALVETQTTAIFGDVKQLTKQMQEVVGAARSLEEVMQRVQEAVQQDKVECLLISVGTQRRAVLEAIAFGAFLRDVETYVDSEYQLLTHISSAGQGPFGGSPEPNGDNGGRGGGGNKPVVR